jgi:UDP-N-acetylmuramate dehydrogenase
MPKFLDLHHNKFYKQKMRIKKNVSLKEFNTFGIDVKANFYCEINSLKDLDSLAETEEYRKYDKLILGGGSNILFTKNVSALVIKNNLKGITKKNLNENQVIVKASAGETWHDLVLYCLENDLAGLENLSLIPGSVGAAPMQNIGAYGVEIKDVFHSLEGFNIQKKKIEIFDNKTCAFGYRESIFKGEAKGKYIIISVSFILSKTPNINTAYGAIEQELQQMGITQPTIRDVSEAVCTIRKSKLPNPKEIGNAGSFFKNPLIETSLLIELKEIYPTIVSYKVSSTHVKLAAGWLIEQCGWKGKQIGNCGVHNKQALVLVNNGSATGQEIYNLSTEIINSVKEKFKVTLEREVNIV